MKEEILIIDEQTQQYEKVNIAIKEFNINEENDMNNGENEHLWRYKNIINHRRSGMYWGIKLVRTSNNRLKKTYRNTKTTKKFPMFNVKKETVFRYDMNEILKDSTTDGKYISSFIATTISKGSRQSIQDARDYINEKCEEEIIDRDVEKEILGLLNRSTRYR